MKTKLIKLQENKFILVSDEFIKKGDWYFDRILGITKSEFNALSLLPKIIASNIKLKIPKKADESKLFYEITNTLPAIDFSLLSEADCKRIGWVDVEKLWARFNKNHNNDTHVGKLGKYQFFKVHEYIASQSLNDTMFSLDDVKKALSEAFKASQESYNITSDEIIQSLQQTSWDVEVEMNTPYADGFTEERVRRFYGKPIPRIANNSIKILRIL